MRKKKQKKTNYIHIFTVIEKKNIKTKIKIKIKRAMKKWKRDFLELKQRKTKQNQSQWQV